MNKINKIQGVALFIQAVVLGYMIGDRIWPGDRDMLIPMLIAVVAIPIASGLFPKKKDKN